MSDSVIVVHGGAGVWRDAGEAPRVADGLRAALSAGMQILDGGGSALDAVQRAVEVLEDCELFNAGRGSVPTSAGAVEMDASIMCGDRLRAGAVACVTTVVHPIAAARAVMERTPHVLLVGAGADRFARDAGLELADPAALAAIARRRRVGRGADVAGETVGAVARDGDGHIAAATSTGGMSGQAPGRVGDSPLIGAGTWAADGRCAVSATGAGELIARACVAHEIDARLRLGGAGIDEAARAAIALVAELGGRAGCIAIDAAGRVAMPFNTAAMPRGYARGRRAQVIAVLEPAASG